jgi:hypothetical protein
MEEDPPVYGPVTPILIVSAAKDPLLIVAQANAIADKYTENFIKAPKSLWSYFSGLKNNMNKPNAYIKCFSIKLI